MADELMNRNAASRAPPRQLHSIHVRREAHPRRNNTELADSVPMAIRAVGTGGSQRRGEAAAVELALEQVDAAGKRANEPTMEICGRHWQPPSHRDHRAHTFCFMHVLG